MSQTTIAPSSTLRAAGRALLAACAAAAAAHPADAQEAGRPADAQASGRPPAWLDPGATYDAPFFPGATYDAGVPAPEVILGFELGSRPASHAELERCLFIWRDAPRMTLHEYARSHEGRPLYYAVLTSPENQTRIEDIRAAIGKLADPRRLAAEGEAERLIDATPAIAWLAYSIHGDELSSTDAAIAVIHHLAACTDPAVTDLLREVVVIVDPLMNPDGRERYLGQLRQFGSSVPSLDAAAMQHGGCWPWGRGNHYLFDLNRDWIVGVHPETRGRQRAVARWQPQLFVDSHEMGPYDTYLFNPPREPFNPHLSAIIRKWWGRFAAEQAAAFDRHGWSYYTREWLEFWYPGYSDAWAAYLGAVGILYEQAGVGGSPIRQPTGGILTYRESVHHHVVSSMANLATLHQNRRAILADFLRQKRDALAAADAPNARTFVLPRGANPSRERAFLDALHNQGIEIGLAAGPFTAARAVGVLGDERADRAFDAGAALIRLAQPAGALVGALLDFDPRMSQEALAFERKSLETKRESEIYDVTGWSLPMAFGLDACWVEGPLAVQTAPFAPTDPPPGRVDDAPRPYAYVIDGADDASFRFLAHVLQDGVQVRVAEKPFRVAGRPFGRGSLLIRQHENGPDLTERVRRAAAWAGAEVLAASGGLSADDGPDLGGGYFKLLHRPRVALAGGSPVAFTAYGAIWRLFDVDVGLAVSLVSVQDRFGTDLRRYNVIILPPVWGDSADVYGPMLDDLSTWVKSGGTLIAVGNAVEPLVKPEGGLSAVRRRRDVLPRLAEYEYAVAFERARGKTVVTPEGVWAGVPTSAPADPPDAAPEKDAKAEHLDEWRRVFSPSGVILRGGLDEEHWLTFGMPSELPVFFEGSTVLMSRHPVATPVRLAEQERLRLSGLLWPEAAARIADSAYATVERVGQGQVILFVCEPDFRGFWHGTRRLLINAVLLGPGCGTSPPVPEP